jgi:hypothetical protein
LRAPRAAPLPTQFHFCISSFLLLAIGLQIERGNDVLADRTGSAK